MLLFVTTVHVFVGSIQAVCEHCRADVCLHFQMAEDPPVANGNGEKRVRVKRTSLEGFWWVCGPHAGNRVT